MANKDLNEKNIEKACNDELNRRAIVKLKDRLFGVIPAKPMRPHMRPHTWVFLRQKDNKENPVICLGIVFNTWDRAKFNMIKFTAHQDSEEVSTSGRLTVLDNGETGIVLDVRWPWTSLLKRFRGLSAGDL